MTFRATNVLPADAYRDARKIALHVRNFCQARATAFASGSDSNELFALVDVLRQNRATLLSLAATPGIAAYAQGQENDNTYDVAAEFNAMVAAIETVVTNIVAVFPDDAQGYLLSHTFNADGSRSPRSFTAAQLANVVTDLNAVVTEIV